MPSRTSPLVAAPILGMLLLSAASAQPEPDAAAVPYLDRLRAEAAAIAPTAQTDAVREFLSAADRLTTITPRDIWFRPEPRAILSDPEYAALPEPDRAGFSARPITDENYYQTGFGTPLCYTRCLDIAADAAALPSFHNRRILDYGYGQIGQLRLLAACGADAVGVDPAPGLAARYALPEDQGPFPDDPKGGAQGAVTLVHGFWPGDEATAAAVGSGFDIILARNVLKHGYVHPIGEVPPGARIDLSVPDEEYLAAVHAALNPGGVWVIYNLGGPRLRAGAYDPSADINCPWTREALEAAGFEVLEFDMDDSGPTREHAVAFGWAKPTDPLGSQWFSLYTVCRKPR
jgi:hypothetical protein